MYALNLRCCSFSTALLSDITLVEAIFLHEGRELRLTFSLLDDCKASLLQRLDSLRILLWFSLVFILPSLASYS